MSNNPQKQSFWSKFSSCLCCISSKPIELKNFEKIKSILNKVKLSPDSDTTLFEHLNPFDLCQWSQKVLALLPEVDDSQEIKESTAALIEHFKTIKQFYATLGKGNLINYKSYDIFLSGIQAYECILSLAFIVFQKKPNIINDINNEIKKAESLINELNKNCCSCLVTFTNNAIFKKLDKILENIDSKIGDFGLVQVAEYVADIIEVFAKFIFVDLTSNNIIVKAFETVDKAVKKVSSNLKLLNSDYYDLNRRDKKWGLLVVTQKLQTKTDKFEARAPAVRKFILSLEKFYNLIIKLSNEISILIGKSYKFYQDKYNDQNNNESSKNFQVLDNLVYKIKPITFNDPTTQLNNTNETISNLVIKFKKQNVIQTDPLTDIVLDEIESVGILFQKIETIICYLILFFKNEEDILYPLAGHIDECSRIIEKFLSIHVVYKITYGRNYLNKIRIVATRIITLFESVKLKLNSPKEIIEEFKKRYPDLIYLLFQSFVDKKVKSKLEILPDSVEGVVNGTLDKLLEKLKNDDEEI